MEIIEQVENSIKNDEIEKARYFGQYIFITGFIVGEEVYYDMIEGVDFENDKFWVICGNSRCEIKDCQIILEDITNISEKDQIDIFYKRGYITHTMNDIVFNPVKSEVRPFSINYNELIKLRNRCYDLPVAGNYNAFELDWAVTPTNKNING